MKEKPSEWIAISDFMAGVAAIVMLLLVVSVWQKSYIEMKHQQEALEKKDSRQVLAREVMEHLKGSLETSSNDGMAHVNIASRVITLRQGVFALGSACVTPEARKRMIEIQSQLSKLLEEIPDTKIYVEGHTDDRPVSRPVTDFARNCTVYDDNFTLSAARAREARKVMTTDMDERMSRRIVVAGYGDSQPLSEMPSSDSRQRRIEIRVVIDSLDEG